MINGQSLLKFVIKFEFVTYFGGQSLTSQDIDMEVTIIDMEVTYSESA